MAKRKLVSGPQTKDIVVIGDAHDSPKRSKDRFLWISRYCAENPPDILGSIGDMGSFDSLSKHQCPGSQDDISRPSYAEDMESLEEALSNLRKYFPVKSAPGFITLGNHEARAHREAALRPKECGHFGDEVENLFTEYGFLPSKYGEILFIEGVGFTHVPFNTMGKPYQGKTLEQQIARDATFSMVIGHSHRHRFLTEAKIGTNNNVSVFNVGTSLPDGEVEHYAGLSATGWTYGIARLTVCDGKILEHSMISMRSLEKNYA